VGRHTNPVSSLGKYVLCGQNSPAGTRQTDSKNLVWFGEIERKSAKLSKTTFTYLSSFMDTSIGLLLAKQGKVLYGCPQIIALYTYANPYQNVSNYTVTLYLKGL
jgi:hypothetical protein